MFKIEAKTTGEARKRLENLLAGLGAKRGAMMGKIAKRLEVDLRQQPAQVGRRFGAFAAAASGYFKGYRPTPRPRHYRDVRRLHCRRRQRRRKSPQSNKQRPEGCGGIKAA